MDIEQLDAVLISTSLSSIAEKLAKLSEKSWGWDILVPILTAGLVAVIASLLTNFFNKRLQHASDRAAVQRYKESQLIERENLNREAINEVLLLANSCYTNLIAIKDNYSERLTTNLYASVSEVPVIKTVKFEPVDYRVLTRLSFVAPKEGEELKTWSQIPQMEMMFSNYNSLMGLWQERNVMAQEYLESRIAERSGSSDSGTSAESNNQMPPHHIQLLMQITERCIGLTSEVMTDLDDFISNFKEAFKPSLNKELPPELLTRVFHFDEENQAQRRVIFEHEVKPDFSVLRPEFPDEATYRQFIHSLVSRHERDLIV